MIDLETYPMYRGIRFRDCQDFSRMAGIGAEAFMAFVDIAIDAHPATWDF